MPFLTCLLILHSDGNKYGYLLFWQKFVCYLLR